LHGIDEHAEHFESRSGFIEAAVRHFIAHLTREESERRDVKIINSHADALNKEARDVLNYQVPL